MPSYRIVSRGQGVVIDPATGSLKRIGAHPSAASIFHSEDDAKASVAKARSIIRDKFTALFPLGSAPSMRVNTVGLTPAAMRHAISYERLGYAKVEAFEAPLPLAKRMELPAIYAIVAENGSFAKLGATGYSSFVEKLHEASLFGSADAAAKYISRWRVRELDLPLAANARIAELAIGISASLDPATLAPSDNHATAMMRGLKERAILSDLTSGGFSGSSSKKTHL